MRTRDCRCGGLNGRVEPKKDSPRQRHTKGNLAFVRLSSFRQKRAKLCTRGRGKTCGIHRVSGNTVISQAFRRDSPSASAQHPTRRWRRLRSRRPEKKPRLESEEVETITVIGTRASLKSGIERKRNAGTVVDSIVAEDIAQFPDKNMGEALSRVTGVQLSRDFGEGMPGSIRGVDPDLNRVEINGMSVLSANGGSAPLQRLPRTRLRTHQVRRRNQGIDCRPHRRRHRRHGAASDLRKPLELDGPLFSMTAVRGADDARRWLGPAREPHRGHAIVRRPLRHHGERHLRPRAHAPGLPAQHRVGTPRRLGQRA